MSQTKAQLIDNLVQALNFTSTASAPANGLFLSAANTLALATNSAQRLTIDSSGNVGIGTSSPITKFDVNGDIRATTHIYVGDSIFHVGDTNTKIRFPADDTFTVETAGSERMRIDSSGRLLIGATSERSIANITCKTQIEGTDGSAALSITRNDNAAAASTCRLNFGRTRATSLGGVTAVTTNDILGEIRFSGSDGTDLTNHAASIGAVVDGSVSNNTVPGRLVFNTATGSDPVERMRIDSSGKVGIGTTTIGNKLQVHEASSNASFAGFSNNTTGSSSSDGLIVGIDSDENGVLYHYESKAIRFATNNSERMRIDSSGNVGIGISSPTKPSSSNTNTRFMEISSADGADLILGNSATSVSVGDHIGALAFKNVDSNPDSGVPHYAGIRCESANTSGSMDLRFYVGRGNLESDATNMIISAAGLVGIGTSSPVCGLHIDNPNDAAITQILDTDNSAVKLVFRNNTETGNNMQIGADGSNLVALTNATERMRIDSSGVLSIGTTSPSASASKLHVEHSGENNVYFVGNTTTTGARLILQNKNTTANSSTGVLGADAGGQTTASIRFYSADNDNNEGYLTLETRPSGGLPTERMRISSAGNVGINSDANGPDKLLHVSDVNNTSHVIPFRLTNAAGSPGTEVRMEFECGLDEVAYISAKNEGSDVGPLIFATASSQGAYPTEKARIRQNGAFGVGTSANRVIHAIQNSSHGTVGVGAFENGDSSNSNTVMFFATVRDSNAGENFLQCNRDQDNNSQGVSAVAFIRTNGDFDSATNSYGGTSDITLKENIVDAKSQWDDIKNVRVRNFNFKDNPDQKMLGVVAQEIETVCSGLVKETTDEGKTLKTVKYSILYMKAIKALQEAMTRIETLEAEVAALKAA